MSIVATDRVTKRFRNGTLANDAISLAIEPGQVYGLLGPNGAGKTTLVRQVLGLLRPTSGSIAVAGIDAVARPEQVRRVVGFLPQGQMTVEDIRVGEFIYGIARLRGMSREDARRATDALVDRLELGPFRDTGMRAASGGVRRLAGFATAVVSRPPVLVLDEPTNDVDPVRRQLLWSVISEMGREGAAVLLVTHNLAEAERVLSRLAIIDGGRILREGTPAALRSLVTERLRLEVSLARDVVPHPALIPEAPGSYLFDHGDLAAVSAWVVALRESGDLLDFRIGPPSLDDIYTAALGTLPAPALEAVS